MPKKGWRKEVFNLPKRDVSALLWGAQRIDDPRFHFAFDALALMYLLGLRIGEVVLLRYDHKAVIDAQGLIRSVSVPTLKKRAAKPKEGLRIAATPLLDVPVLAHFDWVKSAFDHGKRKGRLAISPWLFPSPQDPSRPISSRMVHMAFVEARKRGGITEAATPHCLRHTVATELARFLQSVGEKEDTSLAVVGRFLRHTKGKAWTGRGSDPYATTRLYVHTDAGKYLSLNDWLPAIRCRAITLPPLAPGLRAVAMGADA